MTHWASRGSFALESVPWSAWLARRFGRVVLSTHLSMLFAVTIIFIQQGEQAMKYDLQPGHLVRCFLLVETWLNPRRWCPNGQIWTVAALAPAWLSYPLLDRLVYRRQRPLLAVVLLFAAILPTTVAMALLMTSGGQLNARQHAYLYFWPPAQFLDFVLGVVSAELASTSSCVRGTPDAHLADACVCAIAIACFAIPNPSLDYRRGLEPLFDHVLAPLHAAFLFFSARAPTPSIAASILAHPALDTLGNCSFEVYLFQWPIHASFGLAGLITLRPYGENFVAFALTLWLFAASYEIYLERPFVAFLRLTGVFCSAPRPIMLSLNPAANNALTRPPPRNTQRRKRLAPS